MTRKWGDTGLSVMGSRHVLTITYPALDETLLAEPVALPTSKPETPQVSFTLAAGHFPTTSSLATGLYAGIVYAGGQNLSGASRTVYCRGVRGGVEVGSQFSASVANNSYWTANAYADFNAAGADGSLEVGDVIGVKVWGSDAGVNLYYKAVFVWITRLDAGLNGFLINPVYTLSIQPAPALGTPEINNAGDGALRLITDQPANVTARKSAAGVWSPGTYTPSSTYHLFQIAEGDYYNTGRMRVSPTKMPKYNHNYVPTSIGYYTLKPFGL